MGREGFEPLTLGLREGGGSFGRSRLAWENGAFRRLEGLIASAVLGGSCCHRVAPLGAAAAWSSDDALTCHADHPSDGKRLPPR